MNLQSSSIRISWASRRYNCEIIFEAARIPILKNMHIFVFTRHFLNFVTKENIKMESHPFYHIICDWFSWRWKKILKWLTNTEFFKTANFWKKIVKISWTGPWVSRIDWCKGHWCGSTFMAVKRKLKNRQKMHFFASSLWKSVTNYVIEWMGLNFDVFFGFQQIPCYA